LYRLVLKPIKNVPITIKDIQHKNVIQCVFLGVNNLLKYMGVNK